MRQDIRQLQHRTPVRRFGVGLAAALLFQPLLGSTVWAAGSNAVTVDKVTRLAKDGTARLSGRYRCAAPDRNHGILLGATLKQGAEQRSINGLVADCDGLDHAWSAQTNQPDSLFGAGDGHISAALLALPRNALPVPHFVSGAEQDVTVVTP